MKEVNYSENLNIKLSFQILRAIFYLIALLKSITSEIWSNSILSWHPLLQRDQDKYTNAHTLHGSHFSKFQSLIWFIHHNPLCPVTVPCSLHVAWVWCQTSDTHAISLTLGVKVFFSCCCPTSSALLHFPISLSVALPLTDSLSLFFMLCLPSSSSLFSALSPSFHSTSFAFMPPSPKNKKYFYFFSSSLLFPPINFSWRWSYRLGYGRQ